MANDPEDFCALDEESRVDFLNDLMDEKSPNTPWIAREHAEMLKAVWEDREEIESPDGSSVSPRLHLSLHGIAETQYESGDPLVVRQVVDSLLNQGWERHDAMHLICMANVDELFLILDEEDEFDSERFTKRLLALVAESENHPPPGN